MAHPLDGDWDSIVFDSNSTPQPDGKFSLLVAGTILDPNKSNHGANSVSGDITQVQVGGNKHHRIHIVDDKAKPRADYFGVLLFDISKADGTTFHIIVGTQELTTGPLKKGRKHLTSGQEEGTWVATKQG